jgi:hypothetical protein
MCGLVAYFSGYSNGFGYDESKAFTDMLFVDTLRGWDSTGVFGVSNKGNVNIIKAAITGPEMIATQDYKDLIHEQVKDGLFLVGHNRAATRGVINDANAHPFVIDDNIILVQNGTWNGTHHHIKNTEVDTETVAHIIHEEEDIEKALQKINAAYALIWYNVKEKAMYAIRNSQRPLFTARTQFGGEMLASEASTILFAASRQNIKLTKAPYEIAPGHLCKWSLDDKSSWEFEGQQVDYMYKHSGGGNSNQNFPSWAGHNRYSSDYEDVYPNLHRLPAPNDTRVDHVKRSNNDITNTIHDVIAQGAVKDWEMSEEQCTEMYNDLNIRPKDKPLAVEFVDYIKCNNRTECSAFYVVGKTLTTDTGDTPTALVYTLLFDKTEMEVMDIVQQQFYTIVPTATQRHWIKRNNNHVVTVYGSSMKKLNIHAANDETQNQTH